MNPTAFCCPSGLRCRRGSIVSGLMAALWISTAAAELRADTDSAPAGFGAPIPRATRVPVRSASVPAQAGGPVSVTTELSPLEPAIPLMPEGMENAPLEALAPVEAKKRWTLSVESRAIYDDNISLSRPGKEEEDFVFLLTPSLRYQRGDVTSKQGTYVSAGYAASASVFASHSEENSLDHSLGFDAQKRLGRLVLGVDGRYQRLSGATVELSDRVDRDEAAARVRARYELGGNTMIDASAGWNSVHYREGALEDYDEWVAETYVGYRFSGRTEVAVGGAMGQLNVEGQQKQDFTRALVKVSVAPAGKLTLEAKGGMEWRDTEAGSQDTPVFDITAAYRPTARTAISGTVYRDVTASGSVDGENVTRTGASLRVQQSLGRSLTAGIEAGYEELDYEPARAGAPGSRRKDEYFFIRPSLRYELRQGRRLELYYSRRHDDSTIDLYDFDAAQAGLAFACDF